MNYALMAQFVRKSIRSAVFSKQIDGRLRDANLAGMVASVTGISWYGRQKRRHLYCWY